MSANEKAHPRCKNASNSFHECTEYCFKRIYQEELTEQGNSVDVPSFPVEFGRQLTDGKKKNRDEAVTQSTLSASKIATHEDESETIALAENNKEDDEVPESVPEPDFERMNPRQKKLFELRLKLNQARKANQTDVVAEKKRAEQPADPRGISKKKWFEDKKKQIGKQLEASGLEMREAYMLDTQEEAETKYKKWKTKDAPFAWDVFNQQTLYSAYKKRTKDLEPDMEAYKKAKSSDPEFYREATSLLYGQSVKDSEEDVDRMVRELEVQQQKRKEFSRRRKYNEDKDIDSINDRNEHFNRKIERAFGKYTVEIKNNLERGTALPE